MKTTEDFAANSIGHFVLQIASLQAQLFSAVSEIERLRALVPVKQDAAAQLASESLSGQSLVQEVK